MPKDVDAAFYDRADAHIHLANEHIKTTSRGKVSASFLYGASRFNSWITACGFDSSSDMSAAKAETVEYFVSEFRKIQLAVKQKGLILQARESYWAKR